jgi:hypothetical protein
MLYCMKLAKTELHFISYYDVIPLINVKSLCSMWAGIWSLLFTAIFQEPRKVLRTSYTADVYSLNE